MKELIKVTTTETGQRLVSARELYLGLGLNEKNWSRWYPTNILENDFFKENIDWMGVQHDVEGSRHNEENLKGGRPTTDFAISLEFAKHIAMMARTEKSHQYRNYFIECEKKVNQIPQLSKEVQAIFLLDQRTVEIENKITSLESSLPLFNVECKELQALVRKVGINALGGKSQPAYKDNSLRGKVYADIQHQLKREFGVTRYEAIKRCQLNQAREIVEGYKAPIVLQEEIRQINSQVNFKEVI